MIETVVRLTYLTDRYILFGEAKPSRKLEVHKSAMTRVRSRGGATRRKAPQPEAHAKTQGMSAHPKVDNLVLQLQRSVGNRAVQEMIAAGALGQPAVQLSPRPVPLESLTHKSREKFGAARQRDAIKGIRRLIRALRRTVKQKPTKANQWILAHAFTIIRKYQVSGDMVSCYNALVTRLKLPGRRMSTVRYICLLYTSPSPRDRS